MRKLFILIIILAALAVFVWPTRFKNYDAGVGPYAEQAGPHRTRVDRMTAAVYVFSTDGEWKPLKGARPDLLRPDITGPRVETRVDTAPAIQQGKSMEQMQAQASAMEAAARAEANR